MYARRWTEWGIRGGLAAALLTSCTYWKAEPAPELAAAPRPRQVRVLRSDGSWLTLRQAWLVGDTLVGVIGKGDTTRIPLSETDSLEVRSLDGLRTALAVGGLAALVVAAASVDIMPESIGP